MAKLADFMLKKKLNALNSEIAQFIAGYCSKYGDNWSPWKGILKVDQWGRGLIWNCVLHKREAKLKMILNKIG